MKHIFRIATVAAAISLLSGCVIAFGDTDGHSDWRDTERRNMNRIEKLDFGMEMGDVRREMGEPQFVEAFKGKDGDYKVLFYRTQHQRSDGETTRDETTPVVFRDGHLVGYGKRIYDAVILN